MDIINPIVWNNTMLVSSSVTENDYSAWSSSASYALGNRVIHTSTHRVYQCISAHQATPGTNATITITAGNPATINWTAHGLLANAVVTFVSTGALPTGIVAGTSYYVIAPATNSFYISDTPSGAVINASTAGTGIHTGNTATTATVTITNAIPGVITWTAHGLVANTQVVFNTTSALPIGLTAGTTYYVLAPGASTFTVALTPGGTAINTSSAGSGTQTGNINNTLPYALGSTFWANVAPTNKYAMVDEKWGTQTLYTTASSTVTIPVASPAVITWNTHGRTTGDTVTFTSSGTLPTGLSLNTVYYVAVVNANTFRVSLTNGGTLINVTTAGSGTITCATCLTVIVTPGNVINSLALLNLIGSKVIITSNFDNYSYISSLQSDVGVYDWYTYFMAPIIVQDDIVVTTIPPYGTQQLSISIVGTGTVAIGNLTMGAYITIGTLQKSPKVSIVDYSRKTTDDYGNITVTERAYSKRFSCSIVLLDAKVDQLASLLASIRAIPVVWVGLGSEYASLIVWGFYKDFEIDISNSIVSYCTLTIEGLV